MNDKGGKPLTLSRPKAVTFLGNNHIQANTCNFGSESKYCRKFIYADY